jgi:ribosome-binding ATPase YchF (GTP1/OBG family)
VLPICARLEQDLTDLDEEEKQLFLEELGIKETGLSRLINCAYDLLGLMSFLTAGKDEVRAWTIKKERRRHRPPERYTAILKEALSELKQSHMTICGPVAAYRPQRKRVMSAARARNTS